MNEFETAMVNEPSVFEPLKCYCIYIFTKFNICELSQKVLAYLYPDLQHTSYMSFGIV